MNNPIISEFPELVSYLEFLHKNKLPEGQKKHTCELVRMYHKLAYHQYLIFNESFSIYFAKESPTRIESDFYLHQAFSSAFSMYSLLRTSLEALRTFRKMMGNTTVVNEADTQNIKRIIDIANDIVKHPMFKHKEISTGAEPVGFSSEGIVSVAIFSPNGSVSKKDLDPKKDFEIVRNYLDGTFKKLTA